MHTPQLPDLPTASGTLWKPSFRASGWWLNQLSTAVKTSSSRETCRLSEDTSSTSFDSDRFRNSSCEQTSEKLLLGRRGEGLVRELQRGKGLVRELQRGKGLVRELQRGKGLVRELKRGKGLVRELLREKLLLDERGRD